MVTCSETEDMNDDCVMSDVGVGWLVGWLFDGMVDNTKLHCDWCCRSIV